MPLAQYIADSVWAVHEGADYCHHVVLAIQGAYYLRSGLFMKDSWCVPTILG